MNRRLGDRGSVVAEFAIALPAVVLLLAIGLATLAAGAMQVRLQQAAATASRLVSRGESDGDLAAAFAQLDADANFSVERVDGLVCVRASAPLMIGPVSVQLAAASCALDGGR